MHVVMAAAEVVPFAKTGGLADVLGALPGALKRLGVAVSVIMPAHRSTTQAPTPPEPTSLTLTVPLGDRTVPARILRSRLKGDVPVYLIEADQYFDRDRLYGYTDDAERFAFFDRAVLALIEQLDPPDVLHCHDWHTALAPVFVRADATRYPGLDRISTVLTIHNLGPQGTFPATEWHLLGLDQRHFAIEGLEFWGQINYLKGGLLWADALTTVSPTYAREILMRKFGEGLDGVLRQRHDALTGILNGADYEDWNPEDDVRIAARYSAQSPDDKAQCKADLQRVVGLPPVPHVPLLGVVSRLAAQKGIDQIIEILPALQRRRVQLVILGTGDAEYEIQLRELQRQFPGGLAVCLKFDDAMAHKIEAGADIFLMPSRYEPCGLNQIYSLRYGTIPVVRATGGLEDTVVDVEPGTGEGTGFKFHESADALLACVERALRAYGDPGLWRRLVQNAMRADFSWERSASAYVALYKALRRQRSDTAWPSRAGHG